MSTKKVNKAHRPLPQETLKKIVPKVVSFLKKCRGIKKRVTNKDLRYYYLQRQKHIYISSVQFRQIVKHIRNNGIIDCLIATRQGYWIATSREEMFAHINSLRARARSQMNTANIEYAQLIEHWDKLTQFAPKETSTEKKKNKNGNKKTKPSKKNTKQTKAKKRDAWQFPKSDRSAHSRNTRSKGTTNRRGKGK